MEIDRLDQRIGQRDDDDWEWGDAQRICLRVAFRYVRNPAEAEDVAQEALLRAWRRRATLRDRTARAKWLAALVRNEAFRVHNLRRAAAVELHEVEHGAEDEQVAAVAERADLQAALERLDETERVLVRLRYDEDMTQAKIADRLGLPEGTVKIRLHRVRAKLRRQIGAA